MFRVLRNGRVMGGVLVVGLLVAVAVWPRAIEVETAVVTKGPLLVTIDEDGRTRVRDRFVVTAPVSGEVMRIELGPGDAVEKGKTRLAVVRPVAPTPLDARTRAEAEAGVQSADAALGRLKAERARAVTARDLAQQQLRRVRNLAAGGAVASEEVERRDAETRAAEDAVVAADYAVAQAEHERDVARARAAPASAASGSPREWVIVAPVDGVVLARHQESQAVVAAGQPLLEIGDPARLEIVADMLSTEAVKIRPGTRVLVEQWGGPETLNAHVRRIEPAGFTKVSALGVEEQRVNVVIDFDTPPTAAAPALGDNFRVEVRVVMWQADAALTVPAGSLFRHGDGWAAYVVEGREVHLRSVTVGQRSGRDAQILSGLDEGAVVVLYPPDTLRDGAKAAVREVR